ncbi:hypothetical protein BDM02DRAFT_3129745 [Thelephora ganbajun]|uniref:Uncharacterized protein n=1 Tax=Thelephora ganbajun TaxID=370292 RepID=A0ACB6ZD45_THEGA|nr:hypothetical protein BDM02DRAFT_3129745 [Thelephora ganbajun]
MAKSTSVGRFLPVGDYKLVTADGRPIKPRRTWNSGFPSHLEPSAVPVTGRRERRAAPWFSGLWRRGGCLDSESPECVACEFGVPVPHSEEIPVALAVPGEQGGGICGEDAKQVKEITIFVCGCKWTDGGVRIGRSFPTAIEGKRWSLAPMQLPTLISTLSINTAGKSTGPQIYRETQSQRSVGRTRERGWLREYRSGNHGSVQLAVGIASAYPPEPQVEENSPRDCRGGTFSGFGDADAICGILGDLWVDAFDIKSADEGAKQTLPEKWETEVQKLMEWLDWSILDKCKSGCGPDAIFNRSPPRSTSIGTERNSEVNSSPHIFVKRRDRCAGLTVAYQDGSRAPSFAENITTIRSTLAIGLFMGNSSPRDRSVVVIYYPPRAHPFAPPSVPMCTLLSSQRVDSSHDLSSCHLHPRGILIREVTLWYEDYSTTGSGAARPEEVSTPRFETRSGVRDRPADTQWD